MIIHKWIPEITQVDYTIHKCMICDAKKRLDPYGKLLGYKLGIPGKCRKGRRTLDDIDNEIQPEDVYQMITEGPTWPYKVNNKQEYVTRDRALCSLIYVTAGRISEVLSLKTSNFFFGMDKDFIYILNMEIHKRKKLGSRRGKIGLPLRGKLHPFTVLVTNYLDQLHSTYGEATDVPLFNFKIEHAWTLVNHMTGLWDHYFRSQAETMYGDAFGGDVLTLGRFIGVSNLQTLQRYCKSSWTKYANQLLV